MIDYENSADSDHYVLLIWIEVGQGPTVLAVGAGGVCLDIFSLVCHFSFLFPFLWGTANID